MYRRKGLHFYKKKGWFSYRRILWVLLVPVAFFLRYLTEQNKELAENIFAGGIYRLYAIGWGFLTEKLPFSLMELGIVMALPIFLLILGLWIRHLVKEWERLGEILIKSFWNLMAAGAIVFFWLTLFCNVNYNRCTFAEISGLTIQESSADQLYELCLSLAKQAAELRRELTNEDEQGAFLLQETSVRELSKEAAKGYGVLGEAYEQFRYAPIRVKPVFFSHLMSYTDLVGVYCPFTMESNINTDVADYSIPSTICHELAHYYGYMREDEANFIAYLVCMNTGNPEYEYSGTMLALIHAGNQLAAVDMDRYQELWTQYSQEVITDLEQNSAYWDAFRESRITEVAQAVNDSYLKANNQADGVKSYGRMVDLLLALYREGEEKQ